MVNTCPQPLKCLQATGSETYDKNFLRECQGLNPQEKVKCVFELTYEKEKPCLPCVCQNICNLDGNLCKYCTCPQPQKCLEITRTLLQECHGLNPAETIKCVFGKIINEVTPCIPCASRILSEFSRRQGKGKKDWWWWWWWYKVTTRDKVSKMTLPIRKQFESL